MRNDAITTPKDELFKDPTSKLQPFSFNAKVAGVFDDMASRSIPGYHEMHELCAELVRTFLRASTGRKRVFDIGCSTGATLLNVLQKLEGEAVELIGVDSSLPMIDRCREKLEKLGVEGISLLHSSFEDLELHEAAAILLNYTLQFISPALRPALMRKCYLGLEPGGIVILSEKTCSEIPEVQGVITGRYELFKEMNGYRREEIRNKALALEGVLIPFSVEQNIGMLREAGFPHVEVLMKNHHFTTIIAVKER